MRRIDLKWSEEATLEVEGAFYPTFVRNSYAVLVRFENGPEVAIALPEGARQYPKSSWAPAIVNYALRMERTGEKTAVLPETCVLVTGAE